MSGAAFKSALAALFVLAGGCDLDGRALLQNYDPVTGESRPVTVVDLDDATDAPVVCEEDDLTLCEPYVGELGPSDVGTGTLSGASYTFVGTGGRVCVVIDPQSVFRDNRMRDASGTETVNPFMEDFTFDDGDLDVIAGLASYYTGTPGEIMGDFVNTFYDDNGVGRRVDLNLCLQEDNHGQVGGTAGRATPEMCGFDTLPDTPYRVALYAFSVPVDDNTLKYAFVVRDGDCPTTIDECALRGDRDRPAPGTLPFERDNVEDMYCEGFSD